MSVYDETPAIDLRKWLWSELQTHNIMDSNDYIIPKIGQIVPIIPIQQQEEMNDKLKNKPYLVYDYVQEYVDAGTWYVNVEEYLFTIYATDFGTMNRIKNLMIDMFRRQDESAKDLNVISTQETIGYLNTSIIDNRWTSPERTQDGRLRSDLIVRVKYVRNVGLNGRYS